MKVTLNLEEGEQEFSDFLRDVDTKKPTKAQLQQLRQYLVDVPDIWRRIGDFNQLIQSLLIDEATGHTEFANEFMKRGCEVQRQDLGYDDSPPIERLLIEHVVTCWLRMSIIEHRYTEQTKGSIPITQANYWEGVMSASQRRFLRSLETLARVRRLTRSTPNIQINVGEKQVNIA